METAVPIIHNGDEYIFIPHKWTSKPHKGVDTPIYSYNHEVVEKLIREGKTKEEIITITNLNMNKLNYGLAKSYKTSSISVILTQLK